MNAASPAPWSVRPLPYAGKVESCLIIDANGLTVGEVMGQADAELIVSVRNAEDVAMRRGWYALRKAESGWIASCGTFHPDYMRLCEFIGSKFGNEPYESTPSAALNAAEAWYRENCEGKT